MKTALKQETYNLSDMKHDPHCGFVELKWRLRVGLGLIVTSTIIMASTPKLSKFVTMAISLSSSLLIWAPSLELFALDFFLIFFASNGLMVLDFGRLGE
jgi:hypothetical protein